MLLENVRTYIVMYEWYYRRRRKFSMSLSLLHGDTAEQSPATISP